MYKFRILQTSITEFGQTEQTWLEIWQFTKPKCWLQVWESRFPQRFISTFPLTFIIVLWYSSGKNEKIVGVLSSLFPFLRVLISMSHHCGPP